MTHYRLNDSMPSAVVLSRNSRSSSLDESRIYQNNTIFLENRQEFSLRLFNPLSEKIGVKIGLNGKYSNHLLVMHPGEVATLDRFVDEQKRMIFETYMYDKGNDSSKKAVENNGIVEIKFFKEKQNLTFTDSSANWTSYNNFDDNLYVYNNKSTAGGYVGRTTTTGEYNVFSSPGVYVQDADLSIKGDVTIDGDLTVKGKIKGKGKRKRFKLGKQAGISNMKNANSRIYLSNDGNTGIGCHSPNLDLNISNSIIYDEFDQKLEETGKIEKGSNSNQNLHEVEVQFETYAFHTQTIYLKPISQKTSYETEVREYCTTCKYRLRNKKWNFCPKCGNDLTIN